MIRRPDTNLLILLVAFPLLWFLPAGLKSYGLYVVSLWLVMSIAAMGLNLTLGYAGLTLDTCSRAELKDPPHRDPFH